MDIECDPWTTLRSALGTVRESGAATYALLGEPGIGKTHLLGRLHEHAAGQGWASLRVCAYDHDQDMPYALLRNLLGVLDGTETQPVVRAAADQLHTLLDDLAFTAPGGASAAVAYPPVQVFTGLLRALARTAPLLLSVDDIHLADAESLIALGMAARHLSGSRLLVLCAARTQPWAQSAELASTMGNLVSEQDGTVCELKPQRGSQLAGLVASLLGAAPEARLCGYLSERTRGNPLLVRETLNALMATGAVRLEQEHAYLVDDVPPMFTRREALLHQVFAKDSDGRELARLISVFGRVDLDYLPLLAQLHEASEAQVQQAFDALVSGGVLVPGPAGWYEFSHPLVGELLYEDIGPAERRSIHARIAGYFRGTPTGLRMPQPERVRHQVEGAGRGDQQAIAAALGTAEQSLATSPLTAARWYGRALQLMPMEHPDRAEMLSRQASAYWKGARPAQALAPGLRALELLEPGRLLDRTVATLVNCYNAMSRLEEAEALLAEKMPDLQDRAPFVAQRAAVASRLGHGDTARRLLARAWELVPDSDPASQVIAYTFLWQVEYCLGSYARMQTAQRELEKLGNVESLQAGSRASAFESAAHLAALAGDTQAAHECWILSQEHSRRAGFADLGGQAGVAQVLSAYGQGRWEEAEQLIAREAVQLEFSDLHSNLFRLRLVEIQILMARTDFRRAAEILQEIQPDCADHVEHAIWQAVGAQLEIAMASPERAVGLLQDLLARAERTGWHEVATLSLVGLLEAALLAEDRGQSQLHARRLAEHAQATGLPRDVHLAALYAAMAGGQVAALREAAAAEHCPGEYFAAQARCALGMAGFEAQDNLAAAWGTMDRLQATVWTKRVESAARRQGVLLERPASLRGSARELSDTELKLVQLLCEGLSNRQIAEVLSYSAKTIEAYLTRLYRKSGCASRVELIVAFERGDLVLG